jgi:hypothetical protein
VHPASIVLLPIVAVVALIVAIVVVTLVIVRLSPRKGSGKARPGTYYSWTCDTDGQAHIGTSASTRRIACAVIPPPS